MAPNRKGCRALAMPQRQIWVDRIILCDQRVRPDPHLVVCVASSRRPPGRPRSARIDGFDIPAGQTNAGADDDGKALGNGKPASYILCVETLARTHVAGASAGSSVLRISRITQMIM